MNNLMRRKILFYSAFSLILACLSDVTCYCKIPWKNLNDSIDIQVLYNGRAWRNLYYKIKGDPFLFTTEILPGSVTVEGKTFNNIPLKYDIYNDELITLTDRGIILQLNKEMIDLFTINYNDKILRFKKLVADSVNSLSGYVNILYDGNISLYIKYRKEILLLAVENKYDMFNEIDKIYLEKDGKIVQIHGKREFINLFSDQKQQVQDFIKGNKIRISKKVPESFIPLTEYYDKLRQ
jgi:hypothetical protein